MSDHYHHHRHNDFHHRSSHHQSLHPPPPPMHHHHVNHFTFQHYFHSMKNFSIKHLQIVEPTCGDHLTHSLDLVTTLRSELAASTYKRDRLIAEVN